MSFAEILGQQRPLDSLRKALEARRLHHAYLFVGPDGVGKRTVALGLTMALHCSSQSGDFCGACSDCARIKRQNHPDVRLVAPLEGKKEVSIQQIRDMERDLRYRSYSGGRKIAILDPANLLNLASQNALLKTLEEPPENSLLILVATSAGALLPTLRSRCLRLNFGPLESGVIAQFLEVRRGMATEEARFLAALSSGSLGRALELDGEAARKRRQAWGQILSRLNAGDYRAAMAAAEETAASRDESLDFLRWLQGWYRDVLIQAIRPVGGDAANPEMLGLVREHAAAEPVERILAAASEAEVAAQKVQRNLNRRMVLEHLFFAVVGKI